MRESDGIKVAARRPHIETGTWHESNNFFSFVWPHFHAAFKRASKQTNKTYLSFCWIYTSCNVLSSWTCFFPSRFGRQVLKGSYDMRRCFVASQRNGKRERNTIESEQKTTKINNFYEDPSALCLAVFTPVCCNSPFARSLTSEHTVNLCVAAYQNSLKKHKFRSNVKTSKKKRFPKTNKQRCAL